MTRKKKAKGFKVVEVVHFAFLQDRPLKKYAKIALNSLEKCEKITKYPSKNVMGEYCPKITGCCWDHQKKQEDKVAS